jgi:hypothetical protein
LLVLAAAVAACAGGRPSNAAPGEVRVQVANVGLDQTSGAHVVLLKEETGERALPILIGENEAQAIFLKLHDLKPPRPLTHDLLASVIEQTGNRVDRVVIAELRDEIYFAKIYLDDGRYTLDSRPSDAIALAMRADVPIFVSETLLLKPPPSETIARLPHSTRAFGITVQQLTPELASHFKVPAGSGVLVSDLAPDAEKSGLKRGDVIVRVADRDVKTLDDYRRGVLAVWREGQSIELVVRRDGAELTVTHPTSAAKAQAP